MLTGRGGRDFLQHRHPGGCLRAVLRLPDNQLKSHVFDLSPQLASLVHRKTSQKLSLSSSGKASPPCDRPVFASGATAMARPVWCKGRPIAEVSAEREEAGVSDAGERPVPLSGAPFPPLPPTNLRIRSTMS